MAYITLDRSKLKSNYIFLEKLFNTHKVDWSIVTKVLCGHKEYISEILNLGIKQICDSRVYNLKAVKSINPNIETIYIKPPAKRAIKGIIKYADVSINTHISTVELLSQEAKKVGKIHKVIIMVELGELREGVLRDKLIDFYYKIHKLDNIDVIGIGANLSCLYGVLPNEDKLIQLTLFKQIIEEKFSTKLKYISGGSSVTIPMIFTHQLHKDINHFRVGETLYLGTNVYNNSIIEGMHNDVFKLYAEIIELKEKPKVPTGDFGTNLEGDSYTINPDNIGLKSYRALIDMGLLDNNIKNIFPTDPNIEYVGGSSDMFVYDLGKNSQKYKVGDLIEFTIDYIGLLNSMNSVYIEKRVI